MAFRPTRRAFCIAAAAALAAGAPTRPALAINELARRVKAAYLSKLAPFVTWPEASFAGPDSDVVICVVGDAEFGRMVDEAVAGVTRAARRFAVHDVAAGSDGHGCHLLYLGAGGGRPVRDIIERVRGRSVLTVTDEAHDSGARGIIHLVIRNERVRFEIDLVQAHENGLVVSSRLLELAVRVKQANLIRVPA